MTRSLAGEEELPPTRDDHAVFITSAPEKRIIGRTHDVLRGIEDIEPACAEPTHDLGVKALVGEE